MAKGYKVVNKTREDGIYQSCFTFKSPVKYPIGESTKRPKWCGPLTVFETIEDAREFIWHYKHLGIGDNIFECSYAKSHATTIWNPEFRFPKCELPEGTMLADSVTLIKEEPLYE